MEKFCYIVAGPNGAGKSTFAQTYLPSDAHCEHFINADLIAAGLSPLRPTLAGIEAARILLNKMDRLIRVGATFGFETTLSGRGYIGRIRRMKAAGYRIFLFYLKIPNVEIAIARVRSRVVEGGHDVPEEDIRRRFERSWTNFDSEYRALADDWVVFDNGGVVPFVVDKSR